MELSRLIQHPEEMSKETLYDLRELLALYPYYQTARLLMLQNLYILHDSSFDEELRKAAIYITDRKIIFQMVEAAHYQLKKTESHPEESHGDHQNHADRTSSLIDNFLDSIPADAEDKKAAKKRRPTPADAAIDYVSYLLETENEEEQQKEKEKPSRTMALIDDFMGDGGFKLPKVGCSDYKPEYTPELEEESGHTEETENSGYFTETLARIYIKQGKYEKALDIITNLHNKHPHKSAYYADQMRFLEKLIMNNKKK